MFDTEAAPIEAAAQNYAAERLAAHGRLWTRATIRAELESAFIAGNSHARRLAVVEMDDALRAARGVPAELVTWWLYAEDGSVLTSVRAGRNATAAQVRELAIQANVSVPICAPGVSPYEWRNALARARVKQ